MSEVLHTVEQLAIVSYKKNHYSVELRLGIVLRCTSLESQADIDP